MTVKDNPSNLPDGVDHGSFRDPGNRVFYHAGRVYRALDQSSAERFQTLASKPFYRRALNEGRIVATEALPAERTPQIKFFESPPALVLHHQTIPFISYPYEWSFSMLRAAALLHLTLMDEALQDDMILKDASAYNVQWQGCQPVFIDMCSFEAWRPGPWMAYRQFCQLFLNPLLLWSSRGIDPRPLLRGAVDGISPQQCRALLRLTDWFRAGVFRHVILHAMLERRYEQSDHAVVSTLRDSGFPKELIVNNVRGLIRVIKALKSPESNSHWTRYSTHRNYSEEAYDEKKKFVEHALSTRRRSLIWDLGCNLGEFSRLAAEHADEVVAIDSDVHVIEHLFKDFAGQAQTHILPLVIDCTDPSPGLGWRSRERKGLTERRHPDLILCLALVHHLAITGNIPLEEIISWLASAGDDLIVEFVSKQDSKAELLLKNKDISHDDYTRELFESVLKKYYHVQDRWASADDTRTLYYGTARTSSGES